MLRGKRALFLLPFALFLFLVASELVERSMYTDGLAYAGVAKNMSNGIGSFWFPRLTEFRYPFFHGHPPLAFGMQSLFFRVFGDGLATERIFAGTVFWLSAAFMVAIWREVFRERKTCRALWFLPLTLWLANEVVYHFYAANVLEPTMNLFLLAAVCACLRAVRSGTKTITQISLTALAGLLICGGVLVKGFVALFPLAFFALFGLVSFTRSGARSSFSALAPFSAASRVRMLGLTALLLAVVVGCFGLLWLWAPARESLTAYVNVQLLPSLLGEPTGSHFRTNRFYIIKRAFEVLLPALLLTGLIFGLAYRKHGRKLLEGLVMRYALLFLGLGVAASFPLAISLKQSFYYLLPSMAFYALGLGMWLAPAVAPFFAKPARPQRARLYEIGMALLLLAAVGNTARHWGQVTRRDRIVVADIDRMTTVLPAGATVGCRGDIGQLVSYLYRFHEVVVDTTANSWKTREFVVVPKTEELPAEPLELGTEEYDLYRRDLYRR